MVLHFYRCLDDPRLTESTDILILPCAELINFIGTNSGFLSLLLLFLYSLGEFLLALCTYPIPLFLLLLRHLRLEDHFPY